VDMMGRYVVEYLKGRRPEAAPEALVTRDVLARNGFGGRDERR
jgi:hypothetical protein